MVLYFYHFWLFSATFVFDHLFFLEILEADVLVTSWLRLVFDDDELISIFVVEAILLDIVLIILASIETDSVMA